MANTQFVQSVLLAYLGEMGVSRRLLEIAGRVAPGELLVLSDEELLELNIRTEIKRTSTSWRLTPYGVGLRLIGTQISSETGESVRVTSAITFACTYNNPERIIVLFEQTGNPIAKLDIQLLRRWVTSGPYLAIDQRWIDAKDRFSVLQKKGVDSLHFSLHLTKNEFLSLGNADTLRLGIGMPSSLDGGPGEHFDFTGARESVPLLLRNCER